ncbi:JmjC-domain-containing protein [Rozella allomycis CSF55]|uniref:JmjC-domain-containing protein n=1 Tax=Rozella allomycis (strain CSF55) TaxID=988480 RepID=A0A075AYI7_ROZAC|nr:JmjC domain-containing protein [Rozella allomycis CSF55]RKP21788.1 JmjC-domain-containing protein [Rozella allomycis CSF55]|eukprot:EPZ35179.1 JmjC domain-containing protein [Rozella allomycis CSF55]
MDRLKDAPIFRPTFEEFQNFNEYVNKIKEDAQDYGICKIIPPKNWSTTDYSKCFMCPGPNNASPNSSISKECTAFVKNISIKSPIEQQFIGSNGIYRVINIEKKVRYSIDQLQRYCESTGKTPPNVTERMYNKLKPDTSKQESYYNCLESAYWKSLSNNSSIYGADLDASLMVLDQSLSQWNLSKLDDQLKCLTNKIPGVNTPYLYFGTWKATFAWHVEDLDLYSINYMHFGEPKQWYAIPRAFKRRFEELMKNIFSRDFQVCPEFLRHKSVLVSPIFLRKNGIPVVRMRHYPGEFMITFPYGYHAGFNYGFNAAEAINFALEDWVTNYGLAARSCKCRPDSVKMDKEKLLEMIQVGNIDKRRNGIVTLKLNAVNDRKYCDICLKPGDVRRIQRKKPGTLVLRQGFCIAHDSCLSSLEKGEISYDKKCEICWNDRQNSGILTPYEKSLVGITINSCGGFKHWNCVENNV